MKYALLALILVLLLPLNATAFGYIETVAGSYYYVCSDDYPDTYGNNFYAWALLNDRTDAEIVNWTWFEGVVGVLPGSLSLEAEFPLPRRVNDPIPLPRPWYNTFYRSDTASATVMSTIWWSDGTTWDVPIVMPTDVMPEPTGLIVLATAMLMLATRRANRRAP